jgi:hypothetical protein
VAILGKQIYHNQYAVKTMRGRQALTEVQ